MDGFDGGRSGYVGGPCLWFSTGYVDRGTSVQIRIKGVDRPFVHTTANTILAYGSDAPASAPSSSEVEEAVTDSSNQMERDEEVRNHLIEAGIADENGDIL